MPVLLSLLTLVSTATGGLLALRHPSLVRLILGLTGGVVLGVVAFDLLPELYVLTGTTHLPVRQVMVALVGAFLVFHVVEKSLLAHHAGEGDGLHHPTVGVTSALALCGHSTADGLAIGLAFQAERSLGVAVALAVIAHDFADGLNTVSLMLAHGNSRRRAAVLLAADCAAPVLGALLGSLVTVPDAVLLVYLACFTGFLLYIGAGEVLPEAHTPRPSLGALALTVVGAGLMYLVTGAMP